MSVDESNSQFLFAWQYFAAHSPQGKIKELPGLNVTWCNVALPNFNLTFLARPIEDREDLDERVKVALDYASGCERKWFFVVCLEWLPVELRPRLEEILAEQGLSHFTKLTGMATDSLPPPTRRLASLDFMRVRDQETRRAVADINSHAYDVPLSWGRELLDESEIWQPNVHGFVGYLDGQPVSTSTTLAVDDRLYVLLVATLPQYQGRGFGEAVMRFSLEKASEENRRHRTVLHATPKGLSLYRAMGYNPQATFSLFLPA